MSFKFLISTRNSKIGPLLGILVLSLVIQGCGKFEASDLAFPSNSVKRRVLIDDDSRPVPPATHSSNQPANQPVTVAESIPPKFAAIKAESSGPAGKSENPGVAKTFPLKKSKIIYSEKYDLNADPFMNPEFQKSAARGCTLTGNRRIFVQTSINADALRFLAHAEVCAVRVAKDKSLTLIWMPSPADSFIFSSPRAPDLLPAISKLHPTLHTGIAVASAGDTVAVVIADAVGAASGAGLPLMAPATVAVLASVDDMVEHLVRRKIEIELQKMEKIYLTSGATATTPPESFSYVFTLSGSTNLFPGIVKRQLVGTLEALNRLSLEN